MTDAPIANLVPSTPRPVTRRVSLRSWAEPSVQMWWKSALLVVVVMTGVTIGQVRDYLRTKHLFEHGLPVKAKIMELNGRTINTGQYRPMRDVELPVKLEGTFQDGQPFKFKGMLPKSEGLADLGGELELRVDPQNHENWVEVGKERALMYEFMAVFLLSPIAVILLLIAQWRRMGVLKVWRHGKLREAIVVDCRHSAIAPRSRVCRYTIADGDDRRVFHTLYPMKRGMPERGHVLDMIVLPDQPGRALIADFYVREVAI